MSDDLSQRMGLWLFAGLLSLGLAGQAQAFQFDVELDTGDSGSFAVVSISELAGDLFFQVTTNVPPNTDLGADADLQDFYFNLDGVFTGLAISSTDTQDPNGMYALLVDPAVKGGAGASFDYGVNFGNGGGPSGNGTLQDATFTLSADQDLFLSSLNVLSPTNNAGPVDFAAHFQSTMWAGDPGQDSETVGGVIPEPATGLLLAAGLGALGVRGRRRRS